jgi:Family of unknown function (DUF6526)
MIRRTPDPETPAAASGENTMADSRPTQSLANHARWVPLYHLVISTILLANLVWSLVLLVREFSWPAILRVLMAVAFFLIAYYARAFALTVQDRVIRLEMRLRLKDVLPADLEGRIGELGAGQLIALRFAGDAELPGLVREVLERGLRDRTEIKGRIRDWQADDLRV